jgi:WD40-like Beta Propeller Repeat
VRVAAVFVASFVLLVGCTSPAVQQGSLPSFDQPVRPQPEAGDRLLVIRDDGNLVTMLPDGSNVVPLTSGAGDSLLVRQPAWSPDGSQVAWVEVGAGQAKLAIAGPAGSDRREVDLDLAAFFLQWDPTGSHIAFLGSVLNTIGLGVATDDGSELSVTPVGSGSPLYLAWSPKGDRLLVHVNEQDLGIADLAGGLDDLGGKTGTFQAPAWLPDGRLLYALEGSGGQRLVVRDGRRVRTLASIPNGAVFVPNPQGTRVAYRMRTAAGGGGAVFVMDIDGGRPRVVTHDEAAAFLWSPDGKDLLLLTVERGGDLAFRWKVWNRGERFSGEPFLPSPSFLRDYVPFFDQYAPGIGLWSPDGAAFAYAGLHDGKAGIWVQEPTPGSAAQFVSDGSIVAWSAA